MASELAPALKTTTPRRLSQAKMAFTDSALRSAYRSDDEMSRGAKKFHCRRRGMIEGHSITRPAGQPDAGENDGAACLRCGKRRPPARPRAGRVTPGGWRETLCLRWRDTR